MTLFQDSMQDQDPHFPKPFPITNRGTDLIASLAQQPLTKKYLVGASLCCKELI